MLLILVKTESKKTKSEITIQFFFQKTKIYGKSITKNQKLNLKKTKRYNTFFFFDLVKAKNLKLKSYINNHHLKVILWAFSRSKFCVAWAVCMYHLCFFLNTKPVIKKNNIYTHYYKICLITSIYLIKPNKFNKAQYIFNLDFNLTNSTPTDHCPLN